MDPVLDEYLKKKYLQDQEAIDAENKKESESQFYTNLGRGFNTISSAIGGVENDSKFYDSLDTQRQTASKKDKDAKSLLNDYMIQKYKLDKEAKDAERADKRLELDDWHKRNSLEQQVESRKRDQELRKMQIEAQMASAKAANEERGRRTEGAIEEKRRVEAKLSDKQVGDISTHDKAIQALDNVIAQKPKYDTGALSFGMNKVASFFGMDDSEKSAFKSDVGESLAQYIKGISGATVSPNERAALLANVPSVTDNDDTFMAKANHLRARLLSNKKIELDNLRKSGKNVSEYESKDQPAETEVIWDDSKEKRLQELKKKLGK